MESIWLQWGLPVFAPDNHAGGKLLFFDNLRQKGNKGVAKAFGVGIFGNRLAFDGAYASKTLQAQERHVPMDFSQVLFKFYEIHPKFKEWPQLPSSTLSTVHRFVWAGRDVLSSPTVLERVPGNLLPCIQPCHVLLLLASNECNDAFDVHHAG